MELTFKKTFSSVSSAGAAFHHVAAGGPGAGAAPHAAPPPPAGVVRQRLPALHQRLVRGEQRQRLARRQTTPVSLSDQAARSAATRGAAKR